MAQPGRRSQIWAASTPAAVLTPLACPTGAWLRSQAFPLPGEYLFRFKAQFGKTHGEACAHGGASVAARSVRLGRPPPCALPAPRPGLAVWLDLTDDDAAVPRFDGSIVSKVARLSFAASAGSEPLLPAAAASKGVSASSQRGAATAVAPAPAPAPAPTSVPRAGRGTSSGKGAPAAVPRSAAAAAAPTASAARSGSDAGGADGNLDDIFGSDDAPATDGSSTGRGTPGGAAAAGSSEHDGALDGLFDAPAVPAEPATRATPPPQQDDPMGGSRRGRAPVPLAHSMARGGRGTPTGSMSGRGTPTSTAPPPRGGSGPRNFSDLVDF